MNNFFKKIIFVFTLSLGFFVFSGVDAEACEISSFNARPPGWFTINEYSDETPPYIYFDVQTQNCDTQTGNVLNFVIQNVDLDIIGGPSVEVYDIQNIRVRIKQAGSTSSQGGFVNFETTNSNFTIPLIVGEDGNLGSCDGLAGFDDCQLFLKIYNTSAPGSPQIFAVDSAGLGIQYDCDVLCNEDWRVGCPQGAGVPPNVLDYGAPNICSTDTGTVDITTHPTGTTGTPTSVISDDYSTEPLAPLPGFTGNPNLGQWFESLFTLLIVIAGILALIMIVVGGITYVTSESFGGKGKGKDYIINAIIGLVLALGAWVILNTINPNLAEDLNLTIPSVSLDGPTQEWDNGNAAPGTNIAPTASLGGQPIVQGMPWPSDSAQRGQLAAAGITVNTSNDCSPTAGGSGCTSVYFEGPASDLISQIINFKNSCSCEIVITGGSEAWLHRTHGPNKKVVDMRATQSLNSYLTSLPGGPNESSNFPRGATINISGVGRFYAEPSGATSNTTSQHWHITFQ